MGGGSGLVRVTIPASVTAIGDSAFFEAGSLTELVFDGDSSLVSIGKNAFYNSALTSVTLPASVTAIGDSAFERCKDLTNVTVNGTVVGDQMFYMSGVQTANLPNVETVGQSAFANCTALSELSMPKVKHIGQSAFQSTKLTEFTLSDTVESTGSNILTNANITRLTVSLSTLLKDGLDPSTFVTAFYNVDPYENNTRIILTGVDQDVTLLESGLKTNDKEVEFTTAMYQAFLVTDVQAVAGTITNQSGIEVKVNNKPLQTGGAMPADADTDAYLYQLALSYDAGGESGILLQPAFGNLTDTYTAAVDHTVNSVTLTAVPSDRGAAVAVTVNGMPVTAGTGHTTELSLDMGDNVIAITVTAPDENTAKTYTLTVSRNAAPPEKLQISTAEELMAFAADINSGRYEDTSGMLVELTADIDMEGQTWTPIGDQGEYYFEGVFDGNGHTVSNLTLDAQKGDYLGLFGATANTTIRNVHVSGTLHNTASVINKTIGGIVGLAQYCEITGCTAEFAVTCNAGATLGMIVGGIVGEADYCHIENCESDTTLSGKAYGYWGGIAGAAVGTELVNCINRGENTITETSGYLYTGGIAGAAKNGSVLSQCRNLGAVTLSLLSGSVSPTVGGVCGQLWDSVISDCTNYGTVSATSYRVGGIAGQVTTSIDSTTPGIVRSCLNYGTVSSDYATQGCTAGIAASVSDSGQCGSEIIACISLASVSGGKTAHAITSDVIGGVTFQYNYYDSTITSAGTIPEAVISGGTGKVAAELYTQDFVDTINEQGGNFRLNQDGKLEIIPPFYTLTVEGSEAENTGAGEYEAGQKVTIDAGTRPGYRFAGWTVMEGKVTLADSGSAQTTFIMPAEHVTVTANFTKSSSGGGTSSYAITVGAAEHGTVTSSPASASRNSTVTLTVTPDEGYELSALTVTDSQGNEIDLENKGNGKFAFTMPGSKVTVKAAFTKNDDSCPRDNSCPLYGFSDLNVQAWYHDGIHYCLANGLMNGVGNELFAPEGTTTRAQLVTLLWRQAGSPEADFSMDFDDVAEGQWYSEAVRWAAGRGIVLGVSDTQFAPGQPITREQLTAMLYRYAQYEGADVDEDGKLSDYIDANSISEYAVPAMQWARGVGVINGTDGNRLDPRGTATRAQAAAMMQRFCEQGIN